MVSAVQHQSFSVGPAPHLHRADNSQLLTRVDAPIDVSRREAHREATAKENKVANASLAVQHQSAKELEQLCRGATVTLSATPLHLNPLSVTFVSHFEGGYG